MSKISEVIFISKLLLCLIRNDFNSFGTVKAWNTDKVTLN